MLSPTEQIALALRVQADMIGAVHRVCGPSPSQSDLIETLFLSGYCGREIKEHLPVIEAHFAALTAAERVRSLPIHERGDTDAAST
ncbi:hypothetical protein [Hyphomicrobium sp.]|uniref:hypothetical protein n=1 Tax=Hyphomicrobium sp. TaxID=82 RepID=UPI0025C64733|nr:hypothetical protein [Hyphomicrobium sp.]MCC7253845.1 hypothetical protein [Hyphomicrobium sp.]